MIFTEQSWIKHWEKAETALEQARFLFEAGMFDGAYSLAMRSCIQAAKATAERLRTERDPWDYAQQIRRCASDGRLPSNLSGPFNEILKAHAADVVTSLDRSAESVAEVIELAEGFQRALKSAADLTTSHYSPEVMRAAKKKGVRMPPAPFT